MLEISSVIVPKAYKGISAPIQNCFNAFLFKSVVGFSKRNVSAFNFLWNDPPFPPLRNWCRGCVLKKILQFPLSLHCLLLLFWSWQRCRTVCLITSCSTMASPAPAFSRIKTCPSRLDGTDLSQVWSRQIKARCSLGSKRLLLYCTRLHKFVKNRTEWIRGQWRVLSFVGKYRE